MGIKRTRKFDGKKFNYYDEEQYKNRANATAKSLRLKGFYVRITGPMSMYGEYSIWTRKK